MSTKFPETREYSGFSAPVRLEADLRGLAVVDGAVPKALNGTFFRVQPDPKWPPKLGRDIPLNGDGMVTAFSFEDGHVDFRSRYVRTAKFEAESKARRALFGAYRNPFTDDPEVAGLSRGTANTTMLWHGGKLFALKEDSHPVEIDPHTLETVGSYDYDGTLTSLTLSAHPKIDPQTGELFTYGYAARGETTLDIAFYIITREGRIRHEVWFEAPYGCMIHDFGVTRNHALFPITPLCSDLERLKAGGPHFAWDSSLSSYLGVLPREGRAEDLRWYPGATCHATHTMNAWEEEGVIHYDTPTGDMNIFPFFPAVDGSPWVAEEAAPRLSRWSVDTRSNDPSIRREFLTPISGDFPRIDERFAMGKYRIGWIVGYDDRHPDPSVAGNVGPALVTNAIIQHDFETGKRTIYYVGDGCSAQEPQFVPRSPTAPEGDGWLLMVRHNVDGMLSDLVILDTQDISAGPIAVVSLPFRLRRGLHGTWVPREEMAGA